MNNEIRAVYFKEFRRPKHSFWVSSRLIRWRWWIFAFLCLLIIAAEIFTETILFNNPINVEIDELIIYLILLGSVWLLAEILLRMVITKSHAVEVLEIKHELGVQLELAPDWNRVVAIILAFCQAMIDLDNVVLLVLDSESGSFEMVAQSKIDESSNSYKGTEAYSDNYCDCPGDLNKNLHSFKTSPETAKADALHSYCLPLRLGNRVIAKLNLYLQAGYSLSERHISILNSCASDMSIALTAAQLRQEQAELMIDRARSVQRRRISRNLHDVLAQKLVYLRFKLDQFVHSDKKTNLFDIRHDLEQMQTVANESYELVRGTLAILKSDGSPPLQKLLMDHSILTAGRTKLEISLNETGSSHMLPIEVLQQIFYIFGEALSNIERHAAAQKVDVELIWCETELIITVTDDGRGFETDATREEGHYGLTFMRERIELLGGHIDLKSTPGRGTSLTIRLPILENGNDQLTQIFKEPTIL